MTILRSRRALVAGAMALMAPAACGDDDGTSPRALAGTYVLQSVGGNAVPYVYEDDLIRYEILSGSIVLRSDGSCTTTFDFEETDKATGEVETGPITQDCTFSIDGSTVAFDFGNDDLDYALLSDDTLRASIDGQTWLFVKS